MSRLKAYTLFNKKYSKLYTVFLVMAYLHSTRIIRKLCCNACIGKNNLISPAIIETILVLSEKKTFNVFGLGTFCSRCVPADSILC